MESREVGKSESREVGKSDVRTKARRMRNTMNNKTSVFSRKIMKSQHRSKSTDGDDDDLYYFEV